MIWDGLGCDIIAHEAKQSDFTDGNISFLLRYYDERSDNDGSRIFRCLVERYRGVIECSRIQNCPYPWLPPRSTQFSYVRTDMAMKPSLGGTGNEEMAHVQ